MKPLLLLAPLAVLLAGAAPQDNVKTELAKFEGTWQPAYVEIDGKELKADIKNDRLVITGDTFVFTGSAKMEGTIKIDPTQKPRHIDTLTTAGDNKGVKMVGIYEIDAKRLMVCYRADPGTRPTEFSTTDKSGRYLIIYKRVQ